MAGLDVMVTGVSAAGAVVLHARWPAGLAGVWGVLALRQGWLAVRAFRRSVG